MFSASNQHGVHSPFVYDFVTKCLYVKSKHKGSKSMCLLLKSILYFSSKQVLISSTNTEIAGRIKQEFGLKVNTKGPHDIIYIEDISKGLKIFSQQKNVHNNTMVLIDNIHKNKENTELWKNLKETKIVTVTIDLFYCGAIFFRKEQEKEHFKIRF